MSDVDIAKAYMLACQLIGESSVAHRLTLEKLRVTETDRDRLQSEMEAEAAQE